MVRLTLLAALLGCHKQGEAPPSPLQDALVHPVAADAVAIALDAAPVAVAPTVVKIVDRAHSACALMSDATLRCWGGNESGQLGDGTNHDSATPVTPPLRGVKDVVVGGGFACALLDDTSVSCWGAIGNGKPGPRTPTAVPGVRNAKQIFARSGSACASAVDGPLVCWGAIDARGRGVSDGSKRAPTPVPGVDHVVALNDDAALLDDGDVALWFPDRSAVDAVPVRAGVTHVTQLASYHDVACALREDGAVVCFTRPDLASMDAPCLPKPKPEKPSKPPRLRNGKAAITPPPPKVIAQTLPLPPASHLAFDAGLCVISGSRLACLDVEHGCKLVRRPRLAVVHMPP